MKKLSGKVSTGGIIDLSKYATTTNLIPKATILKATAKSNNINVKKVKFLSKNHKLKYGKKRKLKIKITPSNATNKKVTFKVNNKKYAVINSKGVIRAKKKGIGRIVTVTAQSKSKAKIKAKFKIRIVK